MKPTNVTSPARRALAFFIEPSPGDPSSRAAVLLRGAVGSVFLVSGATKFLFDNQGPGRFAKIGFPAAHELASFVGGVEIVCGALLVVGLLTRLAAVPLIVDMVVALVTTKVPLLFGAGPEPVAAPPKIGFWAFAYQARLRVPRRRRRGALVDRRLPRAAPVGEFALRQGARPRRAASGRVNLF
jgi:putative oxidoreductase